MIVKESFFHEKVLCPFTGTSRMGSRERENKTKRGP